MLATTSTSGSSAPAISTAPSRQNNVCLASDLSSGAILAFADFRNGSDYDIAAQRIERNGQLGNPEPVISSVRDVANDQGGKVKVVWVASYRFPMSGTWKTILTVDGIGPSAIVTAADITIRD